LSFEIKKACNSETKTRECYFKFQSSCALVTPEMWPDPMREKQNSGFCPRDDLTRDRQMETLNTQTKW